MTVKTNIKKTAAKSARKRAYKENVFASDYQFDYDTTLLGEGQLKEWFYEGLQESQLAYLRQPARVDKAPQEPVAYDGWESEQPKNWQHGAACQDVDPVVFFNEGSKPKDAYLKPDAEWRQHCPQCPVRKNCLAAARESESVGIWGGVYRWYDKKTHKVEELDDRIPSTTARKPLSYEQLHSLR
jgi:hypothetical protein